MSQDKGRVVFLDIARFLAIGLMTYAHVTDSLVVSTEWQSLAGRLYLLTRGTTAPLFLFVSGWAFAVATLPHLPDYRRWSKRLTSRLFRVLLLCMWGSLLVVPWWHPEFPSGGSDDVWVAFFSLGPLHVVGLSLLLAQGAVAVTRGTRILPWLLGSMALVTVAAAPFVFRGTADWHFTTRGLFNATSYQQGFPLFPWAAFFFVGSSLGFATRAAQWNPRRLVYLFAGGAALCFAVWFITEPACIRWLRSGYGFAGPSLVLQRLGAALALLAVVALVSLKVKRLPSLLLVPSRAALTFYVAHMAMIWGTPLWLGMHHTVGASLTFWGTGAVTAVVLVGEWAAVLTASQVDRVWVPVLVKRLTVRWRKVDAPAEDFATAG